MLSLPEVNVEVKEGVSSAMFLKVGGVKRFWIALEGAGEVDGSFAAGVEGTGVGLGDFGGGDARVNPSNRMGRSLE